MDKGGIKILGNWARLHIVKVYLPELKVIKGAPKDLKVYFHKLAAPQLVSLFKELGKNNLLKYILTWDGSFVPRIVRGTGMGRRTVPTVSSHAYGIAFDINARWNYLGNDPADEKETGTVRPLVPLARKYGFYWGGDFTRPDGMHFEACKLL
jgi:hypothetical protein